MLPPNNVTDDWQYRYQSEMQSRASTARRALYDMTDVIRIQLTGMPGHDTGNQWRLDGAWNEINESINTAHSPSLRTFDHYYKWEAEELKKEGTQ